MSWLPVHSKQALKDAKKLEAAGLEPRAEELLDILKNDPLQNPPAFEKLAGDLAGAYSRRINIPIVDARKTLTWINAKAKTDVQGHGVRATFASIAEELVSGASLKRMLNHASGSDVTLGHCVGKSEAQRRAGWQAVADFIEAASLQAPDESPQVQRPSRGQVRRRVRSGTTGRAKATPAMTTSSSSQTVKSDRARRPGGCSCAKKTSRSGPCTARGAHCSEFVEDLAFPAPRLCSAGRACHGAPGLSVRDSRRSIRSLTSRWRSSRASRSPASSPSPSSNFATETDPSLR